MVIPSKVLVVNEGCTKTPSWVDTSSCDRNGGQVNQKHCKPNRQWCQDLNIEFIVKFMKLAIINCLKKKHTLC